MSTTGSISTVKVPIYRVPPSKYWAQYWNPWPPGIIATLQMIMILGIISMETGNAVVDLFRSNVYSGFWSFPFMMSATIATYACVCAKRTQIKATVALALQIVSIVVLLIVMGFLMAFIATNFTLCIGFQCSQNSSTSYSTSAYASLKQAFISCELACSIVYITLSIMYIILFIKCFKKLPSVHPLVVGVPRENTIVNRQVSSFVSRTSQHWSMSSTSYNRSDATDRINILSSSTLSYHSAQKICPNCKHVSPYIPEGNILECPSCKYQSPLVEHAQQC